MPPEQFSDRPVDARADQFAFCVALYEGLWGRRPFDESSLHARRLASMHGPMAPPERSGVPVWIWPVLVRGLAHAPADRWPDMAALLAALAAASEQRRRWRRRGALGLALGLTAATAGYIGARFSTPTAAGELACEAEPDGLAATWNDEARGALRRAFAATQSPWAEDTSRLAIVALDAWATSWEQVRVASCEARRAGGDSLTVERQNACRERRRLELAALLELLVRADAALVQTALAAMEELGDPRACIADPAALLPAPAPPAAQREAVNELGRALDGVEASIRTARYSEARDALAALTARVESTGHEPLEARLLELRGRAALWSTDTDGGIAALERAADLAEGSGDDRELAETWRYLALWALVEARDVTRGLSWLRRAEASARRLGVDPARSGELAFLRGHHRLVVHQLAQAEQEFRVAVTDFADRGRALRLLEARRALGGVLVQQGRLAEALEPLRSGLAEADRVIGSHHPIYASTAYDLGATLLSLGQVDEARVNLRTAVSVWTERPGELRPDLGIAHISLAGIELAAGRLDAATLELDRADEILRATRTPRHPDLGDLASARAAVAFARGDFPTAGRELDQVIDIYREALGPDDFYLAKVTTDRGWVAIALQQIEAARRDFAAADAVLQGNPELAALRQSSLRGLAVVTGSRGRHQAALAWLDQVSVAACSPETLANYHLWRAVLHWRLGDAARAREHLIPGRAAVAEAGRTGELAAMHVTAAELAAIEASGSEQQRNRHRSEDK